MLSFIRMLSYFSRKARIDNFVFWIHYRLTFAILVVFAVIVGYEVYLRVPMTCRSRYDDVSQMDLIAMCSQQPTYILPNEWDKKVGVEVIYPGIGKYTPGEDQIYYSNYHHVLLALCLQAIFFYLPRFFWKSLEGGKIQFLTQALRSQFLPEDEKEYKKRFIAEYFASNKNNHLLYLVFYALAEFLNFVNVVAQVIFINAFWDGGFSREVLKYAKDIWHMEGRTDALLRIFPRQTKCNINRYGSDGDVQRTDALCVMHINPMNEKIYVFLWFWCITLAVISFLALVYRALTVIPKFRSTVTFLRVRMVNMSHIEDIVGHCGLGDWLILDLLAKNLDPMSFKDVVDRLVHRLGLKQNCLAQGVENEFL